LRLSNLNKEITYLLTYEQIHKIQRKYEQSNAKKPTLNEQTDTDYEILPILHTQTYA